MGSPHLVPGGVRVDGVLGSQRDATERNDKEDDHLKIAHVDDVMAQATDPGKVRQKPKRWFDQLDSGTHLLDSGTHLLKSGTHRNQREAGTSFEDARHSSLWGAKGMSCKPGAT